MLLRPFNVFLIPILFVILQVGCSPESDPQELTFTEWTEIKVDYWKSSEAEDYIAGQVGLPASRSITIQDASTVSSLQKLLQIRVSQKANAGVQTSFESVSIELANSNVWTIYLNSSDSSYVTCPGCGGDWYLLDTSPDFYEALKSEVENRVGYSIRF